MVSISGDSQGVQRPPKLYAMRLYVLCFCMFVCFVCMWGVLSFPQNLRGVSLPHMNFKKYCARISLRFFEVPCRQMSVVTLSKSEIWSSSFNCSSLHGCHLSCPTLDNTSRVLEISEKCIVLKLFATKCLCKIPCVE
jgi:hypothetical protein